MAGELIYSVSPFFQPFAKIQTPALQNNKMASKFSRTSYAGTYLLDPGSSLYHRSVAHSVLSAPIVPRKKPRLGSVSYISDPKEVIFAATGSNESVPSSLKAQPIKKFACSKYSMSIGRQFLMILQRMALIFYRRKLFRPHKPQISLLGNRTTIGHCSLTQSWCRVRA